MMRTEVIEVIFRPIRPAPQASFLVRCGLISDIWNKRTTISLRLNNSQLRGYFLFSLPFACMHVRSHCDRDQKLPSRCLIVSEGADRVRLRTAEVSHLVTLLAQIERTLRGAHMEPTCICCLLPKSTHLRNLTEEES
jgi:hypothetical protein